MPVVAAATVTLTWAEMYFASMVAVRAHLACLQRGAANSYNAPPEAVNWDSQMVSRQGEMAVAKYLNLFWSGMSDFIGAVDVGGENGAEVRTRRKFWYELIVHHRDQDTRPHVLVTTEAPPVFRLMGWCYGHQGKREQFWNDPAGNRPAFFVPQAELRPMAELKAIIGGPDYIEKRG